MIQGLDCQGDNYAKNTPNSDRLLGVPFYQEPRGVFCIMATNLTPFLSTVELLASCPQNKY